MTTLCGRLISAAVSTVAESKSAASGLVKVKATRCLLALLVPAAVLAGFLASMLRIDSPPSLKFVGFRTNQFDRQVAVFRATNSSDQPFSYLGYGPTMPLHCYRTPTSTGWHIEINGYCGNGVGLSELAPHTSIDFEVDPLGASPPFAIGIAFERGTPSELERRAHSRFAELCYFIQHWLPAREPTWSALAQ